MDKGYGILIVSVTILVLCFVGAASATNWSVDGSGDADFTGIQDAINAANAGDTIIVRDGAYTENMNVNKSLMIRSENGADATIVQAKNSDNHVFEVTADYVNIRGFTVTGAADADGIRLYRYANHCDVSDNNCSNNACGIVLHTSSNNSISKNTCKNNSNGIHLCGFSNNNTISNNTVSENDCDGIHMDSSSNNNTISNNSIWNNWNGIFCGSASNNTISNNMVCKNNEGIFLIASNNTISNNICKNNYRGIMLDDSSNNKIYLNNFINNSKNVKSSLSTNIWNSPLEIAYTYDGTTYESYLGNYWDDYGGTDAEGDGIGDSSYSIDSESDESDDYPLMKPFENYILTTSHE